MAGTVLTLLGVAVLAAVAAVVIGVLPKLEEDFWGGLLVSAGFTAGGGYWLVHGLRELRSQRLCFDVGSVSVARRGPFGRTSFQEPYAAYLGLRHSVGIVPRRYGAWQQDFVELVHRDARRSVVLYDRFGKPDPALPDPEAALAAFAAKLELPVLPRRFRAPSFR